MYEVEVFTRFAGLGKKLEPVDVIQVRNKTARLLKAFDLFLELFEARGSGLKECTWQDRLLSLSCEL